MIWIYNLLITILAPIWVPWMLIRVWRRKEPVKWQERYGNYEIPTTKSDDRIWIHAVSVGEVVAAQPILVELRKALPDVEIVLSVTTSSGHQTAREQLEGLFDHLVYFPMDVARFCLAALSRVRPRVVGIMETELWFNFLWTCDAMGVTTSLINGRISDSSFRRKRTFGFMYRPIVKLLDHALMQTKNDAERFKALGGPEPEVTGNAKFDQARQEAAGDRDKWRQEIGAGKDDFVIVVGSTRDEHEERLAAGAIMDAFPDLQNVRVVHAPRHLERADAVAALYPAVGRRSKGEKSPVLLLDTYGELAPIYAAADVAVVGGGFSDLGGQNLIQPLAHGAPVIHGPHMSNFRAAATEAMSCGASRSVESQSELTEALKELRDNEKMRRHMGSAARQMVDHHSGAAKRIADRLVEMYEDAA